MEKRAPVNEAATPPLVHLVEAMGRGSDMIPDQEARGQSSFVNSTTLPSNVRGENARETLESYGVKFLEVVDGDPMFQHVELPEGWSKQASDHAMWSYLVDDKGRKRASIFYKAAFYDRDAFLNLNRRFSPIHDYTLREKEGVGVTRVMDGEEEIFATEPVSAEGREGYEVTDLANQAASDWLDEHYPDWMNPAAYWD